MKMRPASMIVAFVLMMWGVAMMISVLIELLTLIIGMDVPYVIDPLRIFVCLFAILGFLLASSEIISECGKD